MSEEEQRWMRSHVGRGTDLEKEHCGSRRNSVGGGTMSEKKEQCWERNSIREAAAVV